MATSNPEIPIVREGVLYDHTDRRICPLDVEAKNHTAWRQWSRNPKNNSFGFHSELVKGFYCTIIKERRPSRSGSGRMLAYWYAIKNQGGTVYRQYAGSDRSIDLGTIENAIRKMVRGKLEQAVDGETRQAWQQARRQIRRRPPPPRREMPAEPSEPGGQLPLWG